MDQMPDQLIDQDAVIIADEIDLIGVRHVLRAHARAAGLSLVEETKLITAGSELARNILIHTTDARGQLYVEQLAASRGRGVRATFTDEGPGIEDLDAALKDGFSTVGSLGLGLPGSRRLVDEMTITSSSGSGTAVVIVKWRR